MSFFCLSFQKEIPSYLCDYFYTITPQLFYRDPHWIFGDLSKVLHLYPNIENCRNTIIEQVKKTGYTAHLAFGITPHEAEALSQCHDSQTRFQELTIKHLFDLQGLSPWTSPNDIWSLIDDLETLGVQHIGQLYQNHWPLNEWVTRWGDLGSQIYHKLFSRQYQCLLPIYLPEISTIQSYKFYEVPISNYEWLKNEVFNLILQTLERLISTKKHSKYLTLICYHEFDRKKTQWNFSATKPTSEFDFWKKLIESELLHSSNLNNPIEEIEILFEIEPIHYSQGSLFESNIEFNESKFHTFLSWMKQKGVQFGFLQNIEHPFFEHQTRIEYPLNSGSINFQDSKNLLLEPTYLLKDPIRLPPSELNTLVLHPQIQERFDTQEPYLYKRHYFLARNPNAQWMWIFYNPLDQDFYMHGYFD